MIRTKDDLLSLIKERIGDSTTDEDIKLIEDITDTYTDLETRVNESGDWKKKYEENDATWRKKYKERFFTKPIDDKEKDDSSQDDEETEPPKPLTFDALFKEE